MCVGDAKNPPWSPQRGRVSLYASLVAPMIALRAPGHKEITMADRDMDLRYLPRAHVFYEWSWFDPDLGHAVSGWSRHGRSRRGHGVHFEAETIHPAETVQIHPESR